MGFIKRWQDAAWLVVLLILAYLAYRIIPAIDPRAGIDGFGDLFNALLMGVKGVASTIMAYLCKRLYWWEPSEERECRWHDEISSNNTTVRRAAATSIILDRLEYIAWLAFWLFVFF